MILYNRDLETRSHEKDINRYFFDSEQYCQVLI